MQAKEEAGRRGFLGHGNSKCKGPEVGLTKSIVMEAVGAGATLDLRGFGEGV